MPDRYGQDRESETQIDHRALDAARRIAAERAIADCELCDDHGYRGSTVCDHIDHTAAARRGMDMIREVMGWDR